MEDLISKMILATHTGQVGKAFNFLVFYNFFIFLNLIINIFQVGRSNFCPLPKILPTNKYCIVSNMYYQLKMALRVRNDYNQLINCLSKFEQIFQLIDKKKLKAISSFQVGQPNGLKTCPIQCTPTWVQLDYQLHHIRICGLQIQSLTLLKEQELH